LLFLRDHASKIAADRDKYSFMDAVKSSLQASGPTPVPGWFENALERGKCLIMFDGLDEVANQEQRAAVIKWVDDQMVRYGKNRFVLTSRPGAYEESPSQKVNVVLEVRPFDTKQQEKFVHNWYLVEEIKRESGKVDSGVRTAAARGADDLIGRIRQSEALSALAVNPLLLTMITCVHRSPYCQKTLSTAKV
jgi:predicted NACHT family NTPase